MQIWRAALHLKPRKLNGCCRNDAVSAGKVLGIHKLWCLRTFIWIKSYDGGRSECRNLKIPAFEFQTLILKLFLFFCVLTVMLSLLDFLSSQLLILWNRKRQVGYFIELACLSALLVWAEMPSIELLTVSVVDSLNRSASVMKEDIRCA